MERMNFSINISASKERVWNALWNLPDYERWTSVFEESSSVVTDQWKEGSKVLFVDGKGNGMVSMVAANRPNEFMSFRHLGVLKNGVEQPVPAEGENWSGSLENYHLSEKDGGTELRVEMDIIEQYRNYFAETWPKALQKIREIAEGEG